VNEEESIALFAKPDSDKAPPPPPAPKKKSQKRD